MNEADVELARTLDARVESLAPRASIIAQNPRSTIQPALPHVRSQDNVALRVLGALTERQAGATGGALEIERTLGEGGMGVVHLATQVVLGRKVAVKTLKAEHRTNDATLKLLQEAWITGGLEHPNVVPVYDIGIDPNGGPVIVLKRIEGVHWGAIMHDAKAVLARGGAHDALEWNLRVLMQVCNAVHFAHSRGVVHRDLKPENVMIGEFGEVYVLDWGLAVSLRDDPSGRLPQASDAREIAGTPCYMAPEMLGMTAEAPAGARIDERTDVYLLGAILFEILNGRAPHTGNDLRAIVASILLSPPAVGADVPEEAGRIFTRAMARNSGERFTSVDELRRAVEAFLEHRGSTRLAATADARRKALHAELARGAEATPERLFDLLGECRFGYRAALDAWRENTGARRGLDDALGAMAAHELTHGTSRHAAVLIGEMLEPPADLARRLTEKRRTESDAAAHVLSLERMGTDLDPAVGARTRVLLIGGFSAVWTVVPLLTRAYVTYTSLLVSFGVFLLLAMAFGFRARETLSKTLLNRRLFAVLIVDLLAQGVLVGGCALLGMPLVQAECLLVALWVVVLALLAIFVDLRLAVSSVVALVGFYLVTRWPEARYLVQSACSLVMGASLLWIWRPPSRAS